MTFYFNTTNQIKGDTAYNQKNYNLALSYYRKGLNKLHHYARKNYTDDTKFIDAHAYASLDILYTICKLLRHTNINELAQQGGKYWAEMFELFEPLRKDLVVIKSYKGLVETEDKKINETYQFIVDTCEKLSDNLFDSLKNPYDKQQKKVLNESIQWMKRAINLRNEFNIEPQLKINLHLGLLNILDKKYSLEADKTLLNLMQNHLNKYKLLSLNLAPHDKLELLMYQLKVYPQLSNEEKDNIINKGKNLVKKLNKKKFKDLINQFNNAIEEDNLEALEKDLALSDDEKKIPKRKVIKKRKKGHTSSFFESSDKNKRVVPGEINIDETNEATNESIEIYENSDAIHQLSNFSNETRENTLTLIDLCDAADISSNSPAPAPKTTKRVSFDESVSVRYQFFNNSKDDANKQEKFIGILLRAIEMNSVQSPDRLDSKKMASVLASVASYFNVRLAEKEYKEFKEKYPLAYGPLVMLTYSLYLAVQVIDPEHRSVKTHLPNLLRAPITKSIINDHNRYSAPSPTLVDRTNIKNYFIGKLNELFVQLSTHMEKENYNQITDDVFKYLLNSLKVHEVFPHKIINKMNELFVQPEKIPLKDNSNNNEASTMHPTL